MLRLEGWMDIKALKQQGHSIRAIAELTGRARNTVRRALREKTPAGFRSPERASCLDEFKPYVTRRHAECGLSAVRLLAEIKPMGYAGGVDTLRRFVRTLASYRERQRKQKMTVRFETAPGGQAQADWASCGSYTTPAGEAVRIYAFVMVLSFSRVLFVTFTTDMRMATLLACHQEAFEYSGGWPQTILYDNMKSVKLSRERWNPQLVDFTGHYGIVPKTHQVRRPRTKGKVERMVAYVKDSFLNGRSFADFADLRGQCRAWLSQANARIHATTGRQPCALLAAEGLTALAAITPYRVRALHARRVDAEGFVHLARGRYSVPPQHVGERVTIEQGAERVTVRAGDLIIAEHRVAKPGETLAHKEHLDALWRASLKRGDPPPSWQWSLGFREAVAATPLAAYEEVAR
jgi:transposase